MNIHRRLNAGLGAVLALLIAVCAFSYLTIRRLELNDAASTQNQDTRSVVSSTLELIADAESGERAFILTGDTTYLAPYARALQAADSHILVLESLTLHDSAGHAILQDLERMVERRLDEMTREIDERRRHGALAAARMLPQEQYVTDSLRTILHALDRQEMAELQPRRARDTKRARRAMFVVLAGMLVASVTAAGLGVVFRRDFLRHRRNEARYRAVIEVLAEGVIVRGADGRVIEVNPSAEEILGVPREELLAFGTEDIPCYREDGALLAAHERPGHQVQATGRSVRGGIMGVRRPDGAMRWLLVNASPMYVPGRAGIAGVTTSFADITSRREAEAKVSEHREELQTFLENADELIMMCNPDGFVLYVNQAWLRALGYEHEDDVVGRAVTDFLDAESRAQARGVQRRLVSGETLHDHRVTFVGRDGRPVPALGNSHCRFEHGIPVAVRSIFRDMTEINAAQEQLILAIEQASAANRAKSEFLANMSHELRTPLNSVIGFANVLRGNRHGHLDPQELLYADRIQQNGRHLLTLINNVLDLSKVEAGRMDLDLAPVDLERLVQETLAQLEGQVHGKPVVLRAVVPEGLQPLVTDAVKLKQILINLVGNALKFTPHGSVTVQVQADATHRAVGIDVTDTGIGIPAERQAAVFEAFRQADNTTARQYGGSGLGLTITRSLCQLLGYQVALASEPGHGSTFSVTLGRPADASLPTPADRPRVLIIDDDPDARLLLGQFVQDAGCEPILVGTGEQGLRIADSHRPALILLDLLMPHMNGFEVLERLCADRVLAGIPVVIVSVVATEQRRRAIGAAALIDKPASREEIEQVLRDYMARAPLDKRGELGTLLRTVSAAA